MKISELIKELETCMEEFGDIDVRVDYSGYACSAENIEVLETLEGSRYLEVF
jgi:hypothetical protein